MEKFVLKSSTSINLTFAGAPISRRSSNFWFLPLPTFPRGTLATVRYTRFLVSAVNRNGGGDPFSPDDALEKMMEDPKVQQMVYRHLPEEMRNPAALKRMLQIPKFRQKMQDMINNMGEMSEWDRQMMNSLKNFDLNSSGVKQQFEKVGVTPQEVISKIMANPDLRAALRNPKIQAAIMDCSQNPLSISKYRNDKEIMDVFPKLAALFPGVAGQTLHAKETQLI